MPPQSNRDSTYEPDTTYDKDNPYGKDARDTNEARDSRGPRYDKDGNYDADGKYTADGKYADEHAEKDTTPTRVQLSGSKVRTDDGSGLNPTNVSHTVQTVPKHEADELVAAGKATLL